MKKFIFAAISALILSMVGGTETFAGTKLEKEGAGWFVPQIDYLGPDTVTCGPNSAVGKIALYDAETDTPVIPSGFTWEVRVDDSSLNPIQTISGITASVSPKFCFRMTNDKIFVHVQGSGAYRETFTASVGVIPPNPTEFDGKFFLGKVFLRPLTSPPDLEAVDIPAITNVDPQYQIITNSLLSKYGVSKINATGLMVRTQASPFTVVGNVIHYQDLGLGLNTFSAVGLPDGYFYWHAVQRSDGSKPLYPGATVSDLPSSGMAHGANFILDTTDPETAVSHTFVSTTTATATVNIKNVTKDVTAGLFWTRLVLVDTTIGTTSQLTVVFFPLVIDSEQTIAISTNLTLGHIYDYYFITTDGAGNQIVSPTNTIDTNLYVAAFTPPPPTEPVVYIDTPLPPANFVADGSNINFDVSAEDGNTGDPLAQGDLNWEWRMGNCTSGTLYEVSPNFASSTIGNLIRPDGNPVTLYLRGQEIATGLWSTNCPSVDITINCEAGFTYSAATDTCEPDAVPQPDLVSQNFSLSAGPYTVNTPIDLTAKVVNVGAAATPSGFDDKFAYGLSNVGPWTDMPLINHGVIPTLGEENDVYNYTPTLANTYYFQHCVDVGAVINEASEANCAVVGPYVIDPVPTATLSATPCEIALGDPTCDVGLSWTISAAAAPNVYNDTLSVTHANSVTGPLNVALGPNTYLIQARDGATVLDDKIVTAGCAVGTLWDGVVCADEPEITFEPPSQFIRYNTEATIDVKVTSVENLTCTIQGSNPNINFAHTGSVTEVPYQFPTGKLTSSTNLEMQCTNGVSNTEIKIIKVEVLPDTQEI